jgi:hypothetical protein
MVGRSNCHDRLVSEYNRVMLEKLDTRDAEANLSDEDLRTIVAQKLGRWPDEVPQEVSDLFVNAARGNERHFQEKLTEIAQRIASYVPNIVRHAQELTSTDGKTRLISPSAC